MKNVEGEFEAEDVVDVVDEAGFVDCARPLRALLGRIDAFGEKTSLHRDELICLNKQSGPPRMGDMAARCFLNNVAADWAGVRFR